ncbi:NlpC/P60 family protein [Heyndrickxia sporothermodurans]|uniref:Cell wall-associated NlpC family hydrolase n=1 Tax=Siminovitchia thermophila TaxID=1245522 RepID=A0ABS2R8P4_9BACI|nr:MULTISPECIES: NlpC/P60 family protein [Bacillaceae]MBM7716017.1 cell wall-associated NlpC family hydrolase [Siminovitchia thermophila]MEB6549276.1 NlpC/P60 family protein [Heyndrickxia sporothermodurans]
MENEQNKKSGKGWLIGIGAALGCLPLLLIGLFLLIVAGMFIIIVDEEDQERSSSFGSFCRLEGEVDFDIWDANFADPSKVGALAGYGDTIISLADEYGIDPVLASAIMLHETGRGTSNAVRNYNNPGGIMDPASGWSRLMRFPTMEEGLRYTMANLKRRIIDDGLDTIEKLGAVYAPIGAENDPNGLNQHWVPKVTEFAAELGGLIMNCEGIPAIGNDAFQIIYEEMLKYQGWGYVWAGNNPSTGFDCSGLMQWAYAKAGIQLPRTSYEQYKFSQRITEDELQPGDLIFFSTDTYAPVTHVGMYVGNGKMYDSNHSGIGYSDAFNSYWKPKIVGFGRVADFSE